MSFWKTIRTHGAAQLILAAAVLPLVAVVVGLMLQQVPASADSRGLFASSQWLDVQAKFRLPGTMAPLLQPSAADAVPNRYIVVLNTARIGGAATAATQAATVRTKALQAQQNYGATVYFLYNNALQGYAAALSPAALQGLRSDPTVAYIQQDQVVTIAATEPNPPWGLDRIDQRSLPLNGAYQYDAAGRNVHAYIIDTGIRSTHAEFTGRIGSGYDAVDGGAPDDCNGHGTHVAGTIGGSTYGVAKAVTLHAVRVLDCSGSGTTSGVIAGIDWVTANHISPAVANMSLGGGADAALDQALRTSVAAGVVHVVAAGNANSDACASSPAREPLAITVGATDSTDRRAGFSNYGTCLDIFAPGVNVLSSWLSDDSAAAWLSGTSMASPHTAGVVALYLERSPSASPAQIAADLTGSATLYAVGDAGPGSPYLLLYAGADGPQPTPTGTPPTPIPTSTPTPTAAPPANDDFGQALPVTILPAGDVRSTGGATTAGDDPLLCSGGQGGATVWYRVVAPATGSLTVDTAGSSYDTVLAVHSGVRGSLVQLACNDDVTGGLTSLVQLDVVAGGTYYLEVADYWSSNSAATAKATAPGSKLGSSTGALSGGSLHVAASLSVAVPTPTMTPSSTPTVAPTSTPDPAHSAVLAVAPVTSTVALGQVFTVTVQVRTTQSVDGAAAYLTFDPARLQVAAVAGGSSLPVIMLNQVDNTAGRVDFVAGALSAPFPTADFVLAAVAFTATSPTGSTPLSFSVANPRLSDITFGGVSVLGSRAPGSVTIQTASLVGRAQPPSRPDAPHERWRIPVTVTLQSLAGGTATAAPVLDSAGYFTLTNQPPGAYRVGVRGQNTLQSSREITLALGTTGVDFGLLRGGDANGDNAVTLMDFSMLAAGFARCMGTGGYDPRADFNGDTCATLLDFSLLRTNFGSSGDSAPAAQLRAEPPSAAALAGAAEQSTAPTLVLAPAGLTVTAGSIFTVAVQMRTTQPVDGAAAYIDFDPAVLKVAGLSPGGTLPLNLQNQVDNVSGRINFATGTLDTPVPQSDFIVATLVFTAGDQAAATRLTFALADPRKSDITFGGSSVLGGLDSSSITVRVLPTPPGGSATIQPSAGGTLQGDLGSVSTLLTLPAGAVDEPVEMNVAVVTTPPATGGLKVAGHVFAITAETENGTAVTHFNVPYTLVIHYSDADVGEIDERDLTLHYWSEARGAWIEVPGIVNPAENTLTATLDHLTVFALLEGAAKNQSSLYMPAVIR